MIPDAPVRPRRGGGIVHGARRLVVLVALALIAVGAPTSPAGAQEPADDAGDAATPTPELPDDPDGVAAAVAEADPVLLDPSAPSPPPVTAAGAVVWEPDAGALLYDKSATGSRPMASTTKIMTALVAIEAGTLDDTVTVSAQAAAVGRTAGAASLGLEAGQTLPMSSLLAGLILRSGNDAAVAVAEHVAGGEVEFVALMNTRAGELGLDDTRFTSASGLTDDPDNRASPLDLAQLAAVAMAHEDFAGWAGAADLTVPGLPPMSSRNLLLGTYEGATGVKTGYLAIAGLCLVASAERDGRTLYAVVLGSDDSFADATALLDHGFDAHRRPAPITAGAAPTRYRWADADVAAVPADTLAVTVPADAEVVWRTELDAAVARPLASGDTLGEASLLVDGEVVARTALLSEAAVPEASAAAEPAARVGDGIESALRELLRTQLVDRPA